MMWFSPPLKIEVRSESRTTVKVLSSRSKEWVCCCCGGVRAIVVKLLMPSPNIVCLYLLRACHRLGNHRCLRDCRLGSHWRCVVIAMLSWSSHHLKEATACHLGFPRQIWRVCFGFVVCMPFSNKLKLYTKLNLQ